jgi:hypothetical protein
MPDYEPVRAGGLVEQSCAKGKRVPTENFLSKILHARIECNTFHNRLPQNMASTGAATI